MAQNFIGCGREQAFLLPPDVRDWLPEDHLARFVIGVVDELDLSAIYGVYRDDGRGRPAYEPAAMTALVLYNYAVGVRSSRAIERRCVEDVPCRVLIRHERPDHATIARFRRVHEGALGGLLGQVVGLCARVGLVSAGVVAVDSTKLLANASGLANRTLEELAREVLADAAATDAAEDARFGERRGDELPADLADPGTRPARIRELLEELKAERDAEQQAREAMLARRAEHEARTGRRPPGRPPVEQPKDTRVRQRVNVTDPDSRPVRTPRGFIQGYNAHAVVGEHQIILAADVTIGTRDQGQLEPLVHAARRELDRLGVPAPEVVVADAGYWSAGQIRRLTDDGMTVLVPPDAHARNEPVPYKRGGPYDEMRQRLNTDAGRALYRRRMTMIEPVFGQTKSNRRADRFQRRGHAAVRSEWRLITATHNLLKLWRAVTTPAAA